MYLKGLGIAAGVATAMLLGSCATVLSGTSQELTFVTYPEGAQCAVSRSGDGSLGSITKTPGKLRVLRRKDPLTVVCTGAGSEQTTEIIEPTFSGATLGNILMGGLIGAAVDASSGANNYYPERNIIVMAPPPFRTPSDRDAHFTRIAEQIKELVTADIKAVNDKCNPQQREFCQIDIRRLEEARDRALAVVEQKRAAAIVNNG
ncbi:hypothetical protein [Reyranella sp. CPCC 100927]|uniref:hypothetical protein n=1 Tax=Reyranella sp. CPCC 100927 TaxID=2599616 RepID=UPI0011B650AC|nr:hypothetical protein [Reyranella sp. CPCC 100927]TWS97324.1 hypothetical protein FQU96_37645 [Reyranella sp. CPCC 100927]